MPNSVSLREERLRYEEAVSLAYQLEGAKQKKRELDTHIKKLEQQLLNTEELAQQKLLLSNEGGQKTISGISVEIKRDHVWDQDLLAGLLSDMSKEDWPHFITQQTTYKVDYRPLNLLPWRILMIRL